MRRQPGYKEAAAGARIGGWLVLRVCPAARAGYTVALMAVATSFTRLAGCQVPIQQAPMGSVSAPGLAVAVAEAGGVGSITAMGMSAAHCRFACRAAGEAAHSLQGLVEELGDPDQDQDGRVWKVMINATEPYDALKMVGE